MSGTRDAFVVPAGLRFLQEEGGLAIENEGDIILHGNLGQTLRSVRSNQGNVELFLDADLKEVVAHRGSVQIHGSLNAESVHGKSIEVGGSVTANGIYGGTIKVAGSLRANSVNAMEGGIQIGGDATIVEELSADEGDIVVDGRLEARTVRASDGRIVVRGSAKTQLLEAGSSIVLHGVCEADEIIAGGQVEIFERVEARSVRGDWVRVDATEGPIQSRVVSS
jgi:cytoskeletal protein CcmA (bactofilin family)